MVYERTQPAHILLVEDSDSDAAQTREALEDGRHPVVVHTLNTSDEALGFLRREGEYYNAVRPQFILLAHKLPRLDGLKLLGAIKSDTELKNIPVIMLTESSRAVDKLVAYRHLANSYVVKPEDPKQFGKFVRGIERFWLDLAVLPDGSTGSGVG